MAGKKNIMNAIKRAVSPSKSRATSTATASNVTQDTPLTRFVLDRLEGPSKELFAMSFAAQMSIDKHALVFDLSDALPWLGIDRIDNAIRLLTRHFKKDEYKVEKVFLPKEENSDKGGRPGNRHLISLDQFEDLLMLADTKQGKEARKMYKQLRDAVQDYMKMEMEVSAIQAQKQLEEQTSKLAIEETKRQELQDIHTQLQATIEAQKRREEKKEARKRQQKEPLETAYLMSNNPDPQQGPFKSGCTAGDAKKRAKGMQTGNHEELKVVASVKCVDAELVEKVMHRIFHDYRTNDKLEWFDTDLRSMNSVMRFVARIIDGLNCVNHDDLCVEEALGDVMTVMEAKIFQLSSNCEVEAEEGWPVRDDDLPRAMYGCPQSIMNSSQQLTAENNPFALFRNVAIFSDPAKDAHFRLKDAHNLWTVLSDTHEFKTFRPIPKQGDLKTNLSNLLRVPCKDQLWITRPDKTQEKMCGAFRGFSLHSAEYIQQSCDR